MSATPKVVLDTQIFLRALMNQKSAANRLVFRMNADYELYSTEVIKHEIMEVLNRPKIRTKFPEITDEQVKLVEDVIDLGQMVEVNASDIDPICRDPKDDIFLACAKIAKADYLVSEDKDLLVLEQHQATKIVNVIQILKILEEKINNM